MTSATTAKYVVAWNNYFNDLGGDGLPDIYNGTIQMGVDNNMGDVAYNGEAFASITPNITPVNFSSHTGAGKETLTFIMIRMALCNPFGRMTNKGPTISLSTNSQTGLFRRAHGKK